MDSSLIQTIAVYALPVIFAITLHEAAHGYRDELQEAKRADTQYTFENVATA